MLSVKVMVGLKQDRCHLQQAALPSLGTSDFDLKVGLGRKQVIKETY